MKAKANEMLWVLGWKGHLQKTFLLDLELFKVSAGSSSSQKHLFSPISQRLGPLCQGEYQRAFLFLSAFDGKLTQIDDRASENACLFYFQFRWVEIARILSVWFMFYGTLSIWQKSSQYLNVQQIQSDFTIFQNFIMKMY